MTYLVRYTTGKATFTRSFTDLSEFVKACVSLKADSFVRKVQVKTV